jgi:ParB-like chromosome segregation protein Spo0J
MMKSAQPLETQVWPIDRLVLYARNPRKNDAAVDRMCASIREFGFKIPVLARSDGEVVDGHLRLKAARKLTEEYTKIQLARQEELTRLIQERLANVGEKQTALVQ